MNKKQLIKFEDEIAELYKAGKIRGPTHLSGSNEKQLIEIFKMVKKDDWIFSTWRNHYHWLLSGRSPEKLKQQILDKHSMHVFDDKFFTSAIVGGISPIALGVAWALKRNKSKNRVWCFLGCMGSKCGISLESIAYAKGHNLPITFIIEDNGLSVKTKTHEVWGKKKKKKTIKYKYKRKYPHAGVGVFVLF